MDNIYGLMNRDVKIGDKNGKITDIFAFRFLEITFFNMNECKILVNVDQIDKYLV